MEEMENAVVENVTAPEPVAENVSVPEPEKPSKGKAFVSGLKERGRKFIVNLKRRPMNIAFFVLLISTIVYLCSLGNLSNTALHVYVNWLGLSVFVNTLFCILSLLLFMNAFPKRSKKPKIVMLVLFFAFLAAMIAFDLVFYINIDKAYSAETNAAIKEGLAVYTLPALRSTLAHIVLVVLSAILTATYPLYSKLLNKINTRKVVESAKLSEEIDTEEDV